MWYYPPGNTHSNGKHGPLDGLSILFQRLSTYSILVLSGFCPLQVPNDEWDRIFKVHVMQHVFVARHLFPLWQQRPGEKHLVITASAAGLLTQVEGGWLPVWEIGNHFLMPMHVYIQISIHTK